MAEAVAEFDPASLGAEPVEFDPSSLGAQPVDDFDPASLGAKPVQEEAPLDLGDKSSRFLASAAESSLNVMSGATRLAQNIPLVKMLSGISKEMGGTTSQEFLTELEGAAARAKDDYGVNPNQDDKFLSVLASAGGSFLPTAASGPLAPVTTALMMGEQGYQEAEQAGGTETQKVVSAAGNALTGFVTEKLLGVPALLKSVKAAGLPEKTFKALVGSVTKQAGLSFAREGTQETLEQISQDTIAKYIAAYDKDRNVFDGKKLLTTFLAGGIIGSAVGGTLQLAQDASPEQIAPPEQMRQEAETIDSALSEVIRDTTQTPQGTPILSPEAIQAVPKGTPEELAVAAEPTKLSPFAPKKEGESVVSTAIETPEGIVTGDEWNSAHPTMLMQALEKGLSETEFPQHLGFVVQDASGNQRFVGRAEAAEIARKAGQTLSESPELQSEHLKGEYVPKEAEAVSSKPGWLTSLEDDLFEKAKKDGIVDKIEDLSAQRLTASQVAAKLGIPLKDKGIVYAVRNRLKIPSMDQISDFEEWIRNRNKQKQNVQQAQETKAPTGPITQDQAAQTLQPFFTQAVEVARKAGAVDPESAVSEAMIGLSNQASEGKTTLDKPDSLLFEAARRQALKQVQRETAAKRGGGTETVEFEISGARTDVGPRAEVVSRESVSSIEEAIDQMPEGDRKVMRAMMDDPTLSIEELARDTGLSPDQVKKAKQRAREVLKQFVRSQGIGERMAPGASNIQELRRAQYIAASDIYEGLRQTGELSRATFEKNLTREYEDLFSAEEIDQVYAIAQEASESFQESKGRKPFPAIISELLGAVTGEGQTGIANKRADIERRKRGLPAAMSAARRSHPVVWDEAMRMMEENAQLSAQTAQKFREDPTLVPNDTETAILLHRQITAENTYDRAVDDVNSAFEKGDEQGKLEAIQRAKEAESTLIETYDINKAVGTAQGRSLASRRMLAGRDYSLARMTAELRAAKGGQELTDQERSDLQTQYTQIKDANAKLEDRIIQLEEEQARKQAEQAVEEMAGEVKLDPKVKSLVDRILDRLDLAANKARERLRGKLAFVGTSPDPTIIYDLSVIGASKIAHGLVKFSRWSASMLEEFGDGVKPYLKDAFEASNQRVDQAVEAIAPKNEQVKKAVRNMNVQERVDHLEGRMKTRIEEGESLNDLRPLVQEMALSLVRSGTTQLDPLVDSIHAVIEPIVPGTTKRQVMDLISGYGNSRSLDKEKAKVTLRDLKGQAQQLAKLEDIRSRQPIQKTGVERRTPSDTERRLIKEVNEAKKRFGVVVTDPEKQLRSTLDSIRTRITNEIKDLSNQIETGEKPIEGTPAPSSEEIDRLKTIRNRLKETLKGLEPAKQVTLEERIKSTERSLESSIQAYEDQLKGFVPEKKPSVSTPKIEALRAKRDVLKAQLEEIRAADQNLRDTKSFDVLMKSADELQAKLDRGEIGKETKVSRIEDELVTQARDRLQTLRDQMQAQRRASPEGQQEKLDKAIQSVQKSIESYDARLKAGAIAPKIPGPKVTSPVLDRLRVERDAMQKLVQELRKPRLSPEEAALRTYKARIAASIADLESRIARGDFSKRTKNLLDISRDAEAVRLLADKTRWEKKFRDARYEARKASETKLAKSIRYGKEVLNVPRAVKSSIDFSALLRQGGAIVFGHPIRGAKNIPPMLKAFGITPKSTVASAKSALREVFRGNYKQAAINAVQTISDAGQAAYDLSKAEIDSRPNNALYKSSKLYLADLDGELSNREEVFRSELAEKIPGIAASNRAYITFLNRIRADSFDAIVGSLGFEPTPKQLKAISHYINVATGRGDLGVHGSAAETLSTVLWSPRLLISRIQLLTGEPLMRGDAKGVRSVIVKEYARTIGGVAVVLMLGALMGADIEKDPRSSDFGKMKFGDTRIDPWMGLQQVATFFTRSATLQTKNQKGKIKSLTESIGKNRYGEDDIFDVTMNFGRSKLTPLLGFYFDARTGRKVTGESVTPLRAAGELFVPLSVDDFLPLLEAQGIPKGMAMEMLNIMGMSVQHQPKDKR